MSRSAHQERPHRKSSSEETPRFVVKRVGNAETRGGMLALVAGRVANRRWKNLTAADGNDIQWLLDHPEVARKMLIGKRPWWHTLLIESSRTFYFSGVPTNNKGPHGLGFFNGKKGDIAPLYGPDDLRSWDPKDYVVLKRVSKVRRS